MSVFEIGFAKKGEVTVIGVTTFLEEANGGERGPNVTGKRDSRRAEGQHVPAGINRKTTRVCFLLEISLGRKETEGTSSARVRMVTNFPSSSRITHLTIPSPPGDWHVRCSVSPLIDVPTGMGGRTKSERSQVIETYAPLSTKTASLRSTDVKWRPQVRERRVSDLGSTGRREKATRGTERVGTEVRCFGGSK